MNTGIILYSTTVLSGKKLKHISKLGKSSDKKITINCPTCNTIYDRYFKILAKTGRFECRSCIIKASNSVEKPAIGTKYNRWTLTAHTDRTDFGTFLCDCGTTKDVFYHSVFKGASKSCGCLNKELKRAQLVPLKEGSVYGKLTVSHTSKTRGHSIFNCLCGGIVEKKDATVRQGVVTDCGCGRNNAIKEFYVNNPEVRSGANHPSWKGGLTSDRGRIMQTTAYKDWRTDVFTRDNFKCQCCGINSNQLEAHHIIPYAVAEDLRTDVNNGITFCKECHKNYHKLYGRKDLNREQIESFIGTSV